MQKSNISQNAKVLRRQVGTSTTLNRKYVKAPSKAATQNKNFDFVVPVRTRPKNVKIGHFNTPIAKKSIKEVEQPQPTKPHPTQIIANQRLRERQQEQATQKQPVKLTAKELKEQAIKKALAAAAKTQDEKAPLAKIATESQKKTGKIRFGFGRVVLALSCAAAAVFAIVYFINLNMPDIQFRATATQLNATYPNYLPYNYSPTGIASENNVITLSFENYTTKEKFQITEEKSSWDSNSLLNNFVKNEYDNNYSTIKEQGLTIYIGDNKASWVNGGIVYKLNVIKGSLSKKQIGSIAVSF